MRSRQGLNQTNLGSKATFAKCHVSSVDCHQIAVPCTRKPNHTHTERERERVVVVARYTVLAPRTLTIQCSLTVVIDIVGSLGTIAVWKLVLSNRAVLAALVLVVSALAVTPLVVLILIVSAVAILALATSELAISVLGQ